MLKNTNLSFDYSLNKVKEHLETNEYNMPLWLALIRIFQSKEIHEQNPTMSYMTLSSRILLVKVLIASCLDYCN